MSKRIPIKTVKIILNEFVMVCETILNFNITETAKDTLNRIGEVTPFSMYNFNIFSGQEFSDCNFKIRYNHEEQQLFVIAHSTSSINPYIWTTDKVSILNTTVLLVDKFNNKLKKGEL